MNVQLHVSEEVAYTQYRITLSGSSINLMLLIGTMLYSSITESYQSIYYRWSLSGMDEYSIVPMSNIRLIEEPERVIRY
jgi:hypothetical protein